MKWALFWLSSGLFAMAAFFAYYYSEGEGDAWFGIAAFITLSLAAVLKHMTDHNFNWFIAGYFCCFTLVVLTEVLKVVGL